MRRIGEIDIVQRLATLAEVSGTVYPGLRDLCHEAAAEIAELRARQAERHGRPSIELPPGWRRINDNALRWAISYCLRMTGKSLRNELAEKRGADRDAVRDRAAEIIAMQIVEHMRTAQWGVIAPPPREVGTASRHAPWNAKPTEQGEG